MGIVYLKELQIVLKCLPSRQVCIAFFTFPLYEVICVISITDTL